MTPICFGEDKTSFAVLDLSASKIVKQQGHREPLPLASLTKILTYSYALETLGDQFQFETTLSIHGEIIEGILKGDVILKGSGDPLLNFSHLIDAAAKLKALGVEKVSGNLLLDQSNLVSMERLSNHGPRNQPDNPGLSALSLEFNRRKLDLKTNKHSYLPLLKTNPFNGKEPIQSKLKEIPITNPALHLGLEFRWLAQVYFGLQLPSPKISSEVKKPTRLIWAKKSPPLGELAKSGMEYSNNLVAELTLLATQTKQSSLKPAAKSLQKWVNNQVPLSKKSNLVNGSGLHYGNKLSAYELVRFLSVHRNKSWGAVSFKGLFSIAGHSGSLYRRLRSAPYSYRVLAKTGHMDYISNLAGFFTGKSGKTYAFIIAQSDLKKAKTKVKLKNDVYLQRAKHWTRSRHREQDSILKEWIDSL
jgi:D-alanyl-D-alanine carboxypeptidase/D-alanyl-D-alanine-endopeptidase (penicillin-binding protein 4)